MPFTAVRLDVASDGLCNDDELQHVARETAKFCAISKLFEKAGTDLTVTWHRA